MCKIWLQMKEILIGHLLLFSVVEMNATKDKIAFYAA